MRAGREPAWPVGVDGSPPRLVVDDGLAAVVSDPGAVPIRPSRRNLRAHTEVLKSAMRVSPVLPMRFGVVLPGDGEVAAELLRPARSELERRLDELDGCAEFELKVIYDEDDLLRDMLGRDQRLARLRDRLRSRVTYEDRLHVGEAIARSVEARRVGEEARIVEALAPHATAIAAPAEPLPSVLMKVSFLVEDRQAARFEREADRLARDAAPLFRFLLHGPLPPFSFVDLALPARAVA
jgi:hypothetical protein